LRPLSVSRGRQSRPGRPDDPAAAPCRLRLLSGLGYQPSSDAQGLGPRIDTSRGSYGFTGVTARRFAADTRYYSFGTEMFVPGWGWGVVEDRGGAIKGPDRLDLYFWLHRQALEWGKKWVEVEIKK